MAEEGLSGFGNGRVVDTGPPAPLLPLEADAVRVGDKIDGRFEVRQRLGSGGYALVFRAYDDMERIERAIKIFCSRDPGAARREMGAARRGRHPHVVRLRDGGHDEVRDLWYLVFDLVEGRSLAQLD